MNSSKIVDCNEFALGDIAQVGTGSEEDGRGKLWQQMVRQVIIEVEAGEVELLLLLDLVDVEFRENHTAFRLIGVRQRKEANRQSILPAYLVRRHGGQLIPGDARFQFGSWTLLKLLTSAHGAGIRRAVSEVVTALKDGHMALPDDRLLRFLRGHDRVKRLFDHDGRITGLWRVLGKHPSGERENQNHSAHAVYPQWQKLPFLIDAKRPST